MKLKFTKMHGAGNDFIVLDCTREPFRLTQEQIRQIADRHFGIGADQILVVEPSDKPDIDFKYRIFNKDGGEVEQCGNGARCFVKFVTEKNLTAKKKIRVETQKEVIEPEIMSDGSVKVNMGVPSFRPADLPFSPKRLPEREVNGIKQWGLTFEKKIWWFSICSMGNPHVTFVVENLDEVPVEKLGSFVENHPAFPKKVNVGFIEIQDRNHARVRVWERGAGETLSCGTGNCAAAATSIDLGLMDSPVHAKTSGGNLRLEWEGEGMPIELFGPAVSVFDSEISI